MAQEHQPRNKCDREVYDNFGDKAQSYLTRRFSDPYDRERKAQPFLLLCLHEFYTKYSDRWNPHSARLLEIGGGPVIYSLISAVPHVSRAVHSDYAMSNLEEVLLWKNKDDSAHNWSPYFEYVVRELEGNVNVVDAASRREDDLREKLCVVKCDLTADPILDSDYSRETFDIISSHFCNEVVADSISQYTEFIIRTSHYLKPGGFLVSLVSIEESWYMYGNTKYTDHLYLTPQDVRKAHEKVGLNVMETSYFSIPLQSQDILNDCKGILFIVLQKKLT